MYMNNLLKNNKPQKVDNKLHKNKVETTKPLYDMKNAYQVINKLKELNIKGMDVMNVMRGADQEGDLTQKAHEVMKRMTDTFGDKMVDGVALTDLVCYNLFKNDVFDEGLKQEILNFTNIIQEDFTESIGELVEYNKILKEVKENNLREKLNEKYAISDKKISEAVISYKDIYNSRAQINARKFLQKGMKEGLNDIDHNLIKKVKRQIIGDISLLSKNSDSKLLSSLNDSLENIEDEEVRQVYSKILNTKEFQVIIKEVKKLEDIEDLLSF